MKFKEYLERNGEELSMVILVTFLSFVVLYVALVLAATF